MTALSAPYDIQARTQVIWLHRPGKLGARVSAPIRGSGGVLLHKIWIFRPSETVSQHLLGEKNHFQTHVVMRCSGGARSNQAHRKNKWLGIARYTAAVVVTLASLLQPQRVQR